MIYNGSELPTVPRPRTATLKPSPGIPDTEVIFTPGVWLANAPKAFTVFNLVISSPFTCEVAPVTNFFFWTPYPTTTTSSNSNASACKVTLIFV